jgi:uncharacterized membrane protein
VSGNRSNLLIHDYLGQVESELRDLPPSQRQEILDDLRAHIDEARSVETDTSSAGVRHLLARLGDPAELAREARERIGVEGPAAIERVKTGPGGLEIVAIILTALFWPVGIVLTWLSPR